MPKSPSKRLVYIFLVSFVAGEIYAVAASDETQWPFTSVPMFAQLRVRDTWDEAHLVAVRAEREIDLVDEGILDYKIHRVLAHGYEEVAAKSDPGPETQLRRDLASAVAQAARDQRRPPPDAIRMYMSVWDLDRVRAGDPHARTDELLFEEPLP